MEALQKFFAKVQQPTNDNTLQNDEADKNEPQIANHISNYNFDQSGSLEDNANHSDGSSDDEERPMCAYGANCYRKNPKHFQVCSEHWRSKGKAKQSKRTHAHNMHTRPHKEARSPHACFLLL